jgi:Ser-tRNA(Ala) deacylase AlaX
MNTEQIYYEDPTTDEFSAEVTAVDHRRGNTCMVELSRTAFFPQGGGQPSDQGTIEGPNGSLKIKVVRNENGDIVHEGDLSGDLVAGDAVSGSLKWSRRQKYMRIHTAGHLIHDVLMKQAPNLVALKGGHGDKAFLEYRGEISEEIAEGLQDVANEAVKADLPVRSWESSLEELEDLCVSLPPNLPRGKALRAIQIGDFEAMPDGGVHVASTADIGEVVIHHVKNEGGNSTIRYGIK